MLLGVDKACLSNNVDDDCGGWTPEKVERISFFHLLLATIGVHCNRYHTKRMLIDVFNGNM